ncbi:AMP-binding protein [Methylobacterium frigidaeris]|uniref:AMP-dependent synthetase/ligase domain-containing protein n=2 Tax=Methylobacterium frigidaeris TaxID=2038277 RepID=A0AA37H959_9HYPH|nr:AMP-binding protein [Methylobacterium frigidaeris]GJD61610.1 hypothetical protein MPEAHAMD_1753 [Methylobacterium frigidaeris]
MRRDDASSRPGPAQATVPAGNEAPVPAPMGLGALLAAVADRHPARIAFIDQASKPVWCGRPAIAWTYAAAREIAARLAEGLQQLRLPPRSPVGLCMAGMAEAHLAFLAIEQAGHIPCPLPVTWDEDRLLQAVEAAQILAVLTQGVLGAERPAETLCRVAMRYFPLRFIAAFGPHVPDGVLGLDQVVLDHRGDAASLGTGPAAGLVTLACPGGASGPAPARTSAPPPEPEGAPLPVRREAEALTAAAAGCLVPLRVEPGERILSLLPPSDLKGLATGLAAALLAGATLECHPVFDAGTLSAALDQPVPTHLVAPAWMEAGFSRTTVPGRLRTLAYVHRAPCRLSTRLPGRPGVVDIVAFDEVALLSGRRDAQDVGLVLAAPERAALVPERAAPASDRGGLIQLRRDPDGRLSFRGPACAARMLRRGITADENPDGWMTSRFRASLFAGVATAITEIP